MPDLTDPEIRALCDRLRDTSVRIADIPLAADAIDQLLRERNAAHGLPNVATDAATRVKMRAMLNPDEHRADVERALAGDGWHRAKDGQPEELGEYVVAWPLGRGKWHRGLMDWDSHDRVWRERLSGCVVACVTHWRPLPQLPRDGGGK